MAKSSIFVILAPVGAKISVLISLAKAVGRTLLCISLRVLTLKVGLQS